MKKITFIIALTTLCISQNINAQAWLDVTDAFVVNPRFDGNDATTGWEGTAFSNSAGAVENVEHYQKNYDSYQTITGLTPGHYRVSVSAFFRSGSATDDYTHYTSEDPSQYQKAFLYASTSNGEETTPLAFCSSAALATSLGGGISTVGSNLYIPNNMAAADAWFQAGYYVNSVEIIVPEDGQLTIGVRQSEQVTNNSGGGGWGGWGGWGGFGGNSSNWTCLDNWVLEIEGELIPATSVVLENQNISLNLDETYQMSATVLPENASYKKVTWSSSNENVATVDANGKVIGVGKGTCTITATTMDGTELTAEATITVSDNVGTKESMIVNEIMAANIDMYVDPSWNYGGWVELYNPTDVSANIGLFWISDDPDNLKKAMLPRKIGSVPAHGFFTLWFDHADTRKDVSENYLNTQVNMKLDPKGGTLYISDIEGNLITSQDYPASIMRTSFARKTDGGDEWGYTAYPTPTATNVTSVFAEQHLEAPVVDKVGQLFTSPMTVNVTIPEGAHLYYTTDGSAPTEASEESTNGVFQVSASTVYRFRLFEDGYLPSDVVTRSYIYKDKDYYLPVVSLVTDPDNLYDNTIGIYVTGTNGKTANQDYTKRNFNMDWERPANFEYMNTDEVRFDQEVDISISGGWSRKYEPRSFKIKAAKVYGLNSLDYPFFEDKSYEKNKSLLLRNGGNDNYNKYRIKDAALQEIARVSGFRLNLQAYQPTHVFINGKYLAMLNLREVSNKNYAYANYGIDTDDIDAFEMSVDSGYVQKEGTRDAFEKWYTLSESSTDALAYQQICDIVDIDDYINYMAFKFYLYDWDWPHNNTKAFKGRTDGKFHFVVYDLDNCVDWSSSQTSTNIFTSFANKKTHTFYGRPEYNGTSLTKEVELVTIFLNMLKNEDFKKKFIDTYCIVGGCVFGYEDEIKTLVTEMGQYVKTAESWEGNDPTGTSKEQAQGVISAVTGTYQTKMVSTIKAYSTFNLSNTTAQKITLSSSISDGRITYNGIDLPRSRFNGYGFAPIRLKASAPIGYKFVGWKEMEDESDITTDIFPTTSTWSYYDQGSLDDTGWNTSDYSYTSWATGKAPLGYGKSGTMANPNTNFTTLGTNGKPTYYMRKEFTLENEPQDNETYTFNYNVDDGMIAYINGTEIGLYHMQSGAKYENTSEEYDQFWYEGTSPATGSITIDKSVLKKGTNVIAVEVHNCNSTSSDLWFDGSISVSKPKEQTGDVVYESTEEEYVLPATGDINIQAVYEKMSDEELAEICSSPVKINEISASNNIYVNEFYKKNDWIELYNTTDKDIDVAGCYISDKASKPQKFQIPASEDINTIIPAKGYLVIWCDKLDAESQIHTNFKLDADSALVMISAENGEWTDTLTYNSISANCTIGRYPDGGANVYMMNTPTIGETNKLASSDALQYVIDRHYDPSSSISSVIANNGNLKAFYENGYIIVNGKSNTNAQISVYTSVGQNCMNASLSDGHSSAYVGNLPSGIYVAKIKTSDKESCSCKFIIK